MTHHPPMASELVGTSASIELRALAEAFWGEISLVRHAPRTATVTTATDVTAYSVDCRTFLAAVSGPAAAAVTEHITETHRARSAAPT